MTGPATDKPLLLVTGATGSIGRSLTDALSAEFRVVGMDRDCAGSDVSCIEVDVSDDDSVTRAFAALRADFGTTLASVVHLAAYFDFSGEEDPRYRTVNEEGTARLLDALQAFEVGQFVYAGTMLVHAPGKPGERIDETTPIEPGWAYPRSKAAAERIIAERHGRIPFVLLRFAGLYDDETAVPTLAQQIARIHQRELTSHLHAVDAAAGQSMIHRDDLIDALVRTIERRAELPDGCAILVGEPEAIGYDELQQQLGLLLHGEPEWATLTLPAPLAKAGAWLQGAAEPLVPDLIDRGEKPFIRPFMIDHAGDHYALDIARARRLLGWRPRHRLERTLPSLVAALKRDPAGWYRAHGITPPRWIEAADAAGENAEQLRADHEQAFRREHRATLWARFALPALGSWLLLAPLLDGETGTFLAASTLASGAALLLLGLLCLSWRMAKLRWLVAALGCWVMLAPLVVWTPNAAAYLEATLVGALVIAFAVALPPVPGISPNAAGDRTDVPPGWDYSPSSWVQRAPIILLAFVGLYVSRYLAGYQLEQIDGVWDPFFGSTVAGRNGTEAIITSDLSEAWPVPDAGLGAVVYLVEILTGLIGDSRRWRTMPWLVVLFGILIVPLGAVSIAFIVIQPIMLGTWCSLCLLAAAAMLVQIPYSFDELLATGQFLLRRRRAGRSLWRVFFVGDADDGGRCEAPDDFERGPRQLLGAMFGGGVALPWNLAACIAIGLWLMFTRLLFGADGALADVDHLVGALLVTVSVIALAEVARPLRWLNLVLAAGLAIAALVVDATTIETIGRIGCALLIAGLSLRRGPVRHRWGGWNRFIV